MLRLADRLVDNPFMRLSASLYSVNNVRVTAMLEDMEDFFTYSTFIDKILLRVCCIKIVWIANNDNVPLQII